MSQTTNPDSVRDSVRAGYASIATKGGTCCGSGGCCGTGAGSGNTLTAEQVAAAVGYSQQDLATLPEGANMGLSCGNPTAMAALKPGETVVDLGSGGGFDCFIAGPKVGGSGMVIGVDMTAEMIGKARAALPKYHDTSALRNVEFRLGEIEHLPLADNTADVVISNCVLNLSPDQPRVWREIARVLKPGGRVAISDIVLLRALPAEVRTSVEALVGCVAGAQLIGLIENMARSAGLTDIRIQRKAGYIDAMTDSQDPLYKGIIAHLPPGSRIGDYIASVDISASKPAKTKCC